MVPGRGLTRHFAFSIVFASLSMASASFAETPEAPAADQPVLDGRLPGVRPSEITGTVRINGCTVDPSQIRLRAGPVGVRSSDGRRFAPDPRAITRFARFKATDNPHLFRFSIMGLHPRTLYQLGISVPGSPCGKLFWRGPFQGLAMSGGPAVEIEGLAARTEVEIFDPATEQWVGMDNLQFTDPSAAVRTLRWRSSLAGVTGGELQVSTEAFPTRGAFGACDEPAKGIVYRQQVPVNGGNWTTISDVDFGQILRSGRTTPPGDVPPNETLQDGRSDTPPTDDVPAINDSTYRQLLAGAPIYMRVVAITAEGPACNTETDGVHGWVIVARLPGEAPDLPPPLLGRLQAWYDQKYTPPYLGDPVKGHPSYGEVAYKVIKSHTVPPKHPSKMTTEEFFFWAGIDPLGYTLVQIGLVAPGTTFPSGKWFFYMPASSGGDDGFLSNFTSAFGGLATAAVGAFGDLLTYASNLAEEIKEAVAEVVVDVISVVPGIGEACEALKSAGTSCEEMVKAGIEYGLTSVGLPPSIPNWEQAKGDLGDYLASEIASEIESKTGVPSKFTEVQLKGLAQTTINKMTEKRGSGNGPQYDWVLPYMGFDPAVWTMTVKKNDNDPLPSNLFIRVKEGFGLYRDTNVHLPSKFPSNNILRIPVVLQPNTAGIAPPICATDRFKQITCTGNTFIKQPLCAYESWKGGNTYEWVQYDCSWTNFVGVYYRDTWVKDRFEPKTCAFLAASSATADSLWLTYPNPPFVDLAFVKPGVGALWDGNFHVAPGCE